MAMWTRTVVLLVLTLQFLVSVGALRTHTAFSQISYYEPKPSDSSLAANEETQNVHSETTLKADTEAIQSEELGSPHKNAKTPDDVVAVEKSEFSEPGVDNSVEDEQTQQFSDQQYSSTSVGGAYQTNGQRVDSSWYNPQLSQQQLTYPNGNSYNQLQDNMQLTNPGIYPGVFPYSLTGGACPTQYWIANIHRWPEFFNVASPVGDAFGKPATSVWGDTTILQGLLNSRTDAYSSILREGTTAILNAYGRAKYPFSHTEVIDSFNQGLTSRQEAAMAAAKFQDANKKLYTTQNDQCN